MTNGPEAVKENRSGTVARELNTWLASNPDDQSLAETAVFLGNQVADWRAGLIDERTVLQAIVDRYHNTDSSVSELASTALNQSIIWFGVEASVPWDISDEFDRKLLRIEIGE